MLGTRSRMTSQSSFCAEKAPAFEGRKPGALEGGKLHPPHCPSRKTTMSAITSTPAYLSAKARVARRRLRRARSRRPPCRDPPRVRRSRLRRAEGCVRRSFPPCLRRAARPDGPRARPRPSGATTNASIMQAPRRPRDRLVVSGLFAPLVDRAVVIVFTATRRADDATRLSNPLPTGPQPLRAVAEPPGATRSSPFTDVGVEELDPEVRSSDDPSPARLRPSPPPRRFEKPPPPPRRWQPPPVALHFLPTRP